MTGTIFRVARFSVHDGPGIRTTVFLKGCPLACPWCHSPESQPRRPQLAVHDERCLVCGTCLPHCPEHAISGSAEGYATDFGRCRACGACVPCCPSGARELVGHAVTVNDLMAQVERDVVFFDESGGGVTFSGGEPFMQPAFLGALLERCRERRVHAAVDTCGLADPAWVTRVAPLANLFLFDLKIMDPGRHRAVTGAPNDVILGNLRYLAGAGRPLRVRFPLVPGLTDDEANVHAVGTFVRALGLAQIDLLPYHRGGLAKYARLGLVAPTAGVVPPTDTEAARAAAQLASCGLTVQLGG